MYWHVVNVCRTEQLATVQRCVEYISYLKNIFSYFSESTCLRLSVYVHACLCARVCVRAQGCACELTLAVLFTSVTYWGRRGKIQQRSCFSLFCGKSL